MIPMKIVNIHQAKTTLSALLAEVERGEEVTIARNGVPVAMLVRAPQPDQRRPGMLASDPAWQGFRYDPALFAPLSDNELDQEEWP